MLKVERKKGITKPRLVHNKKLFWIIIALGILLIAVIIFIVINEKNENPGNNSNNISEKECQQDGDCIPSSCCHATSCVPIEKKPDCKRMICSMVCSGPLDCGAGQCGCINNKCTIVKGK